MNVSLKEVYDNLWAILDNAPLQGFNARTIAETYLENFANFSGLGNDFEKYNDFENEWKYVTYLYWLYKNLHAKNYDWTTKQYGTFMVKLLNVFGKSKDKCKSQEIEAMNLIKKTFSFQGQELTLPDIGYLYSIMDFKILSENTTSNPGTSPQSLVNMKESFVSCFKLMTDENPEVKIEYFDQELINNGYIGRSPCLEILDHDHRCKDYCNWHQNVIEKWDLKEFITVMKYSLPQRKIMMDPMVEELEMAKILFGETKVKMDLSTQVSPTSPVVFCYRVNQGYTGDDIGMIAKVCNDFFPTPSDIGTVYSKNMDLNNILKVANSYKSLYEPENQKPNAFIKGGSLWTETTLVFFTDSDNDLSQSYKRKPDAKLSSIQFQIHQAKDIPKLVTESNFDESSTMIELEKEYEYFIDITPHGQISTENFRSLNQDQRKCLLEREVSKDSIFKIYTQNNCKYECYVGMAQENCGCIPWDFLHNERTKECDVFGRTCFFNSMKLISQSPEENCKHCLKECDYVIFDKKLTRMPVYIGGN